MAWEYSDKTKILFMNAVQGKEDAHLGELENPDGLGEHGSIACGDAMRFTFRVERHPSDPTQDKIVEARYLTFGCTSAIAASEALCAIIERGGFTPIEALKVTNQDIVNFLGGLPSQKVHCSVMGAEALEAAVYNWAQRRGVDLAAMGIELKTHADDEGRIVCKCFSVSEPYLERKIKELELKTIAQVTDAIKAGGACMTCHHAPGGIQDTLNKVWGEGEDGAAQEENQVAAAELSPYLFAKRIEEALQQHIIPILERDGGSIEIVDIKGELVYVRLTGACAGCAGANITLKLVVENTLKTEVADNIRVIAI